MRLRKIIYQLKKNYMFKVVCLKSKMLTTRSKCGNKCNDSVDCTVINFKFQVGSLLTTIMAFF